MKIPDPTLLYRIVHVDNLATCLRRAALWAPNCTPDDGFSYRTIHNSDIQATRSTQELPCGPGGVVHDYVPFYFGPLSPMLLQLHTGQVSGYAERQDPIIYLVSTVQAVVASGAPFVFSDGHGVVAFTRWFASVADLHHVDWDVVGQRYWSDNLSDMDRKRRKQAEFLVHQRCDWSLIQGIGVIDDMMKARVEETMSSFGASLHRPVKVKRDWYYY